MKVNYIITLSIKHWESEGQFLFNRNGSIYFLRLLNEQRVANDTQYLSYKYSKI